MYQLAKRPVPAGNVRPRRIASKEVDYGTKSTGVCWSKRDSMLTLKMDTIVRQVCLECGRRHLFAAGGR